MRGFPKNIQHMVKIIDYPDVLTAMTAAKLHCVYHNSGSFGFSPVAKTHALGWIGEGDPTIRPEVRAQVRSVSPPYERTLAMLLGRAWQDYLPGPIWLMPASHWAYELQFGSADWLPAVLRSLGIASEDLRDRSDGSALEFTDAQRFVDVAQTLFARLVASDFTVAFPDRPVVAMLHHHKQLWWQTSEITLYDALGGMVL